MILSTVQLVVAQQAFSPVFDVRHIFLKNGSFLTLRLPAGSLPMAVGACAFLGTVIYTFDEAGSARICSSFPRLVLMA